METGACPIVNPTLASAAIAACVGVPGDELALVAHGPAEALERIEGGKLGYAVDADSGEILLPGAALPRGRALFASLRFPLAASDPPGQAALDAIARLVGQGWTLNPGPILTPALDRSLAVIRARPADLAAYGPAPPDGTGVLIGVIDFGCDFAHPAFRGAAGRTRLDFLWDQNAADTGAVPGQVFETAQIDRALEAEDPYAALGYWPDRNLYAPATARRFGLVHGTHVLGVAGGRGTPTCPAGVAPAARLAFVHLQPGALTASGDAADVFDAACAVFDRAARLGCPAVVNLSLGANWGSHDGNTLFDGALDALLTVPGRAIAVAAGNEREASLNADGEVSPGDPERLVWEFTPGDRSPNTLRIFASMPDGSPALVCAVQMDRDTPPMRLDPATGNARWLLRGGGVAGLLYSGLACDGDAAPLQHLEIRVSPSGGAEQIEIELSTSGRTPIAFDAWIDRDDREDMSQSRFRLPAAQTRSTLACTACGRRTLCVGAHAHRGGSLAAAPFSAEGMTRDARDKPDVAAPGLDVLGPAAYGGRMQPGQAWRNSEAVRMSGTSAAAPHAAGVLALMLQLDPSLTADACIRIIRETAAKPGNAAPWDPQLGAGRLDAAAALARVRA